MICVLCSTKKWWKICVRFDPIRNGLVKHFDVCFVSRTSSSDTSYFSEPERETAKNDSLGPVSTYPHNSSP
jgi:hypothetical protein